MIAGILLAAGRSLRMGQPKLLLPWQGVPLVRHVAQQALASKLDELIVVVGHRAAHVTAALHDLPLRIVHNQAFLDGQSTSLRSGLAALPADVDAAVVLLADQPLLRPSTIDTLMDAYHQRGAAIIAPKFGGQRGNPVLFAHTLFAELAAITGDQGAREVLRTHAAEISLIDVDDIGVLLDLDTPDMYEQLIERAADTNRTH